MIAKKVLLVGNFGVGKTSLIRRFVLNEFSEEYISTIGVRVSSKIIQIENQEIKLLIWDVAGTSDDEKVPKAYFLGSSAAMYVFDLSREETYKNINAKVDIVKELSGLKNITIIGNKKDLVSSKENENVEDAFKELAKQTLN